MLNWLTAGESHGPALIATLDGFPAGIKISTADLEAVLARRRLGYGRGARQKFEQDEVRILSGVRHGVSLGSPIAVEIKNSEWPKWEQVMNPDEVELAALLKDAGSGDEREIARNKPLTRPRPGHADLAGMSKYRAKDARQILERASARETAARVVVGKLCEALLLQTAQVELVSHTLQVGTVKVPANALLPTAADEEYLNQDPLRCFDAATSQLMVEEVDKARKEADTLGGVVEVLAYNVPVGLGDHTQWMRKLDGRLAQAIMSIQAFKGVEIGEGFSNAGLRGSQAHDEIFAGGAGPAGTLRNSNRAGGLEGGITNGEIVAVRGAVKPISTVPKALRTIDVISGESAKANHQRSDVCAVAPAAVIAEAMVAITLADALLEKVGGDSISEIKERVEVLRETYASNFS